MSVTLKYLRALSDPTRLRIVALVATEELSVNELLDITRMGQSRISTHLGLLQEAGLVQSRREGKRTFYKLSPPASGTAAAAPAPGTLWREVISIPALVRWTEVSPGRRCLPIEAADGKSDTSTSIPSRWSSCVASRSRCC